MSADSPSNTQDEELLADLFDSLLQEILEGRTPDIDAVHPERPDLRDRIAKTWSLACSVAGRREPSRPVFGGYEILRELGHGGMGTVYLARHQTLQRDVAVKVLPQSLAMSPRAKQRFVEEARSLAQLRHENIVHLHRIVDHAEMLAFEMEYIDGPSLQQLITNLRQTERPHAIESLAKVIGVAATQLGTHTTVEWFVRLLIKVSRALGEVHRLGLVHRDVKPANILLRKNGSPVLADFGLALNSDLDPKSRKFAGTPIYAAPERLRGDDLDVSPVADVYSLGVTLHEVLTLSPPFQGTTTHEVLRRIESGNAVPLRKQAPHISHDLATIVSKAMEPDPRHRYASADALADDLERLLNLQPIHAQPAGPLRRAVKFVRRHQKAFVAATCGAMLVALAAWPLAVLAAEADANRATASASRHAARTQLLCQESLPAWWQNWQNHGRNGWVVQQASKLAPQCESLERALDHYQRALLATPHDSQLQQEAAAVRAALQTLTSTSRSEPQVPNLATTNATADSGAFARGLFAFLIGDRTQHRQLWQDLPVSFHEEPFIDACLALALATEGKATQAYPRVFHAARAYPAATALMIAMAEGALRSGDVMMAKRWFDAIPADVAALQTDRRLLAADLMVVAGTIEPALQQFRELSNSDPSDPRPLLRIVDVALRENNLDMAQRVCRAILQRWPNLHRAHCHMAQFALQQRNVAEYLSHVQHAIPGSLRDPSELDELLALGGLRRRNRDNEADRLLAVATVPLNTFLPKDQLRGIELALDILPTIHRIATNADNLEPRPIATTVVALGLSALRFPDLTSRLPTTMQIALAGLVSLRHLAVRHLSAHILPYQTALGSHFHKVEERRLFAHDTRSFAVFYGSQVLRVGDIDGDTLPDLCIAAPPTSGSRDAGFVELRRGDDGSLLTRWEDPDSNRLFGRSIADLGDIDGDYCSDILIGMPLANAGAVQQASIEARSGRTGQLLWRMTDDCASFGAALAALNDVNGDGIRDCVVGVPPLQLQALGRASIRSGKDGSLLRELIATESGTWFGGSVASAGDLTGDGLDDVLVAGNYGRAPGLVAAFDGQTGERVMTVTDDKTDSLFGWAVAAVDDIDSDGRSDFAISAPGSSSNSVAIISGRTGNSICEFYGERSGDMFGVVLCAMPSWRARSQPTLAISSRRGGPTGTGSVRVFDLVRGLPLQTFASVQNTFGYALVDLNDRDGDGCRDLGMMAISRTGQASLWIMSHADITPSEPMQPAPTELAQPEPAPPDAPQGKAR